ncbi:nucleoside hydrolase [Actinopolymorpha alba]|uniref:nucleoside hydrolase n=1 Tax=Actinopolymorpha alba TaxID=533267 RepID=UPI000372482F|nr:nucleoside hydrolase [Actinopolymorpha alba]
MTRRIIIDTDTAADDCFALFVGLCHPEAQLEAVTIVAGNVEFDQQIENALLALDTAGRSGTVPVYPGCRKPMLRPWHRASAHGDGKGNWDFPKPPGGAESEHAVDALLRLVDESPGEIDIVAIGPLTNLAAAVVQDPDFPRKVRSLFIMGGCNNSVGNVTAAAEYNFYVDPEAARIVLRAGFATTIVTWTLTLAQALWDRERLKKIEALDTPLSRFFSIVNQPTLEADEARGIMGSTHPDSLTAMLLVQPDLVKRAGRCHVDVETQGELTRGYSLFDWRADRNPPNATVVEEIDTEGFFAAMVEILSTSTGENAPSTRESV